MMNEPGIQQLANSSHNAAAANNTSLPAVAGKRTYLAGFQVTGGGATAAGFITVQVVGVEGLGDLNYKLVIPAGPTTSVQPLIVHFDPPLRASAVNAAITVSVPSFGAGNTAAACTAYGFAT